MTPGSGDGTNAGQSPSAEPETPAAPVSRSDELRAQIAASEPERTVRCSIPSRLEMLTAVDQLTQSILQHIDCDDDSAAAIATSVIEAGTNAIQHGHRTRSEAPVDFTFHLGEHVIDIWVEDRGPGFDLDEALAIDPTSPAGLLDSHGRGIFIMRAMMDQVDFEIRDGEGVVVHLRKRYRPHTAS